MIPKMIHKANLHFNYGEKTFRASEITMSTNNNELPVALVDLSKTEHSWEIVHPSIQPLYPIPSRALDTGHNYEFWFEFRLPESPINLSTG